MFLFEQLFILEFLSILVASQHQQSYPANEPVPILKQINRQNEDGSYSYGYEAGDGSYKIESKYPSGEIYGKYGFIDEFGKVHDIEYGATRQQGFQPAGTGINIPPSPINPSEPSRNDNNDPPDDGQYREDPTIYYTDPRYTNGENYSKTPPKRPLINQYSTTNLPHHSIHSTPPPSYQNKANSFQSATYTVNYRR